MIVDSFLESSACPFCGGHNVLKVENISAESLEEYDGIESIMQTCAKVYGFYVSELVYAELCTDCLSSSLGYKNPTISEPEPIRHQDEALGNKETFAGKIKEKILKLLQRS